MMIRRILLLPLFLLTACAGDDSVDRANKTNDERIDKQSVAQDSKAIQRAKDTAEGLVDLSSSGMTELAISKIALTKAENPQVRNFAQQVVNAHQKSAEEFGALAKTLNVTLPAELSSDGKDRVGDLEDMKTSTAFDREYLDQIAELNEAATRVANDLMDSDMIKAVRELAEKRKKSDAYHRDAARQVKRILS